MALKFTNNATATLAASISSTSTSITVTTGQGALFPALAAGDYFYATLVDSSNNIEFIKVTARTGDTLTAVRGQDNSTARAYLAADKVILRLNAAALGDMVQLSANQVITGNNTFTGVNAFNTPPSFGTPLPPSAGGTGSTTSTGSGSVVLATSPTLVTPTLTSATLNSPTMTTPALGTPASGDLTNCTFPTLNQNTTGNAGGLSSGSWTVTISGTKIFFAYGGVNKMSLDSSGNIIVVGNVTGYGTP